LRHVIYLVLIIYPSVRGRDEMWSNAPLTDGAHSTLLGTHIDAQRYLAPSLLLLYGDVERTGFYEKLTNRRSIMVVLKHLWTLSSHRPAFRGIATMASIAAPQAALATAASAATAAFSAASAAGASASSLANGGGEGEEGMMDVASSQDTIISTTEIAAATTATLSGAEANYFIRLAMKQFVLSLSDCHNLSLLFRAVFAAPCCSDTLINSLIAPQLSTIYVTMRRLKPPSSAFKVHSLHFKQLLYLYDII
jgi:hypothetical protein